MKYEAHYYQRLEKMEGQEFFFFMKPTRSMCVCVCRRHEWGKSNHPQSQTEDQDTALCSLDLAVLNLEPDEGEGYTGADSSALRTSKLTGNNNVTMKRPAQHVSDRSGSLFVSRRRSRSLVPTRKGGHWCLVVRRELLRDEFNNIRCDVSLQAGV